MEAVNRIAILGSGTMGARIAALFAAAGMPVLLLDLTEQLAREGAARVDAQSNITPASFEDGIPELVNSDWVLEAVAEDIAIKRALWLRAAPVLRSNTIASTNTSGILISAIAQALPEQVRRQFLGIHFFNPPAKLRLVELIRSPQTMTDIALRAISVLSGPLDRIVVEAKDTPSFIANRIGAYFSAAAQHLAVEGGYSIEEVDALTGPLIGLPKTGTFRLMDVIGLDVWARVMSSPLPPYVPAMLQRGLLGEKSGSGFYRKTVRDGQRSFEVLDLQTLEYRPAMEFPIPASEIEVLPLRLRHLLSQDDRSARFLRTLLTGLFQHCHAIAPQIAYNNQDVDRAMRFGYGWTLGPFELEAALQ